MNALEALKSAKSGGTKIRPTNKQILVDFKYHPLRIEAYEGRLYLCIGSDQFGRLVELPEYLLINNDGSPVEWEVVE